MSLLTAPLLSLMTDTRDWKGEFKMRRMIYNSRMNFSRAVIVWPFTPRRLGQGQSNRSRDNTGSNIFCSLLKIKVANNIQSNTLRWIHKYRYYTIHKYVGLNIFTYVYNYYINTELMDVVISMYIYSTMELSISIHTYERVNYTKNEQVPDICMFKI